MSKYDVVLIPGDGIGPEVTGAACRVIEEAGVAIHWLRVDAGVTALDKFGSVLPDPVLDAIRKTGIALKGPLTTPVGGGFSSVSVALRKQLGLFANLRPVKNLPGVPCRYAEVDLVVIRENTEDLYIGEEIWEDPDTVVALKRISRMGSSRIASFAFEYARSNQRKALTLVHKANILKESDGLFLQCGRDVATYYPDVHFQDRIVDALAMDLVVDPSRHDVLLCPNLYGDIISDLAAGLVGGLGLVPGANIGTDCAVFEAVHGSAPDLAGKGTANPTALILAGTMLLRHLGEGGAADRVESALDRLFISGKTLPPDLGGTASTVEFTNMLIDFIQLDK